MGNLDYTQVLNKIENTRRFGNEPGVVVTAQVIKVLREKGKQKRIIPYIHVAGTNGKGSVCAFFSSILKKEHMRVGTFVSPHLVDFEERITVDGRMIAKEDVTRLGNYLLDIDFGIGLTMFDYCLAMALLYFEEQQCDYMVIETGLGGRLDSTNAIGTPQCAVITKIGYDHMAILGSDIADIAAEKAGIIKENSTVVVEQQDKRAMQVIEQEAQKKHARIITVEQSDIARCSGYALRLCGTFQWENAAAAELAARYVLGKHYGGPEYEMQYDKTGPKSEKTDLNKRIKSALEEAVWPGRMEIVSKEPFLLVDGAHNSNGVDALKESLMQMYPGEKFCFFMGVMADKDYDAMIREILPLAEEFYTVTPDSDRALQASHLADFIRKEGVEATEPSVVAFDRDTNKIKAIGEEARLMLGRTPGNIVAVRPLRQGVISDYTVTEKMLKYFIQKALGRKMLKKPRISVCVPSGVTEVEKKAVEDATYSAGAREVAIIEEPIAAAIGAGIDISRPCGNMIVDIGGGTTDIAVISLGGTVVSTSIKIAGDDFDDALVRYMRKKHSLLIGERTAEDIKIKIGSAYPRAEVATMEVRGRNLLTGLPKTVTVTSEETEEALKDATAQIVDAVHSVLEKTPPELAADIADRGIVLTGGGSLLQGLEELIESKTGINTMTAEDPMTAVAIGTGKFIEFLGGARD